MQTIHKILVSISVIIIAGFFINAINKEQPNNEEKVKQNNANNTSHLYEIKALKML